jgi:RNA recognition motif-containing protein
VWQRQDRTLQDPRSSPKRMQLHTLNMHAAHWRVVVAPPHHQTPPPNPPHPTPPTHPQVSTTRLAVRNIPPSWDEKKLKAVFIAGVKERATKENPRVVQVRARVQGVLSAPHSWCLVQTPLTHSCLSLSLQMTCTVTCQLTPVTPSICPRTHVRSCVTSHSLTLSLTLFNRQVKILRDSERPDAAGHPGGKSRGFGFVEFNDHSHALAGGSGFGGLESEPEWGAVSVVLRCGVVCSLQS